ncbi:hypothetical protein HXX76_014002 [Chlamydomonas incerta]|uniref:Uncharacterized protein n=1 Tax=Chlamydomonas incerta TaxID=51695 RepID=A0A835SD57_CHLIN|nr:hypothetical protein HXX76_014002 [Chlamydomonas incerta]|eukprot:KAG2425093.1 hypothetical protein HXX76_014002 [Chlamydomonas incerta]
MSNSSTLWTSSLSSAACVGLSAAEEGPQGLAHAPSICSPFPRQLSSVSSMPCSPAHGLSMHSHSNGTVDATTTSSGHIVPKPTRASVFSPATYPQQHQQHQHPPQRPLLPPLPRLPPPPSPQYLPAGPAGHLASLQSSVSIASMAAPSKKRKSGRAAEPAAPTRAAVAASGRPSPPARRHVHHNRNHSQPRAPPGINNNSNGSSNGSSSGSTAAAATSAGTTSALAPLAAGFAPTAGLHPLVFANTYFSNPGVVAQLQAMQQAMKPGPSVAPAAAAASNVAVHVPSAPAAPAAAARVVVAAAPPAAALPARDAGYRTGPDLAPISAAGLLLGLESQEGAAAGGDAFMLRSDEMFGGVACDPWAQLFQD